MINKPNRAFLFMFLATAVALNCSYLVGGFASAQSTTTWLRCGNIDGSTNAVCPACVGTCKMDFVTGGGRQTYKICQDTGMGCTMPTNANAFCSGILYDGGDCGGCDGGSQGTCQYNIKKCPA